MSAIVPRRSALLGVILAGLAIAFIGLRPGARRSSTGTPLASPESAGAPRATPELAARTVDRLQLFRTGDGSARLYLTAEEVTALLRHSMPGLLPSGIAEPVVRLDSGSVFVRARVSSADFAGRAPLVSVLGALQDTIDVDLRGRLDSSVDGLVFTVERAHASRVPLPATAVAAIVSALARESKGGIVSGWEGEASLGVRWPRGVSVVAVVDDRLVLDRGERTTDRAVDGSDDS